MRLKLTLILALLLSACGAEKPGAGRAASGPAQPGDPRAAHAAATDREAVLAVSGFDGDEPSLRVSALSRDGAWRELPDPGVRPGDGVPLRVAFDGPSPCLSTSTADGPDTVRCLRDGGWTDEPVDLGPGWRIVELASTAEGLCTLTQAPDGATAQVACKRGEAWRRLGPELPLPGGGFVFFHVGRTSVLTLDVTGVRPVVRRVVQLRSGRWATTSRIRGFGIGPALSGAAGPPRHPVWAINSANRWPWRVRIVQDAAPSRPRVLAAAPANGRRGNAQGMLVRVAHATHVMWREDLLRADGLFDSRLFVRQILPRRGPPRQLWRGPSVGPADAGAFVLGRDSYVWSLRGAGGERLRVDVRRLPRAAAP